MTDTWAAPWADRVVVPDLVHPLLPGGVSAIQQLPTKSKSTVLRIETGAGALVAKSGAPAGLRCERAVYESVLPTLGIPGPTIRGWAETNDEAWLVVDFIPGSRPVLSDPADLRRVSEWAARLHLAARTGGHPSLPPPLGRPSAESRIDALRASTARRSSGGGVEEDALTEIESALPLVAAASAAVPETLTHGDLSDWNLIMTPDGVVAVDWDQACRRSPSIDLALLDIRAYRAGLTRLGECADPDLLERAHLAGIVLASLAHDLGRKPLKAQQRYIARMISAVRALRAGCAGEGDG